MNKTVLTAPSGLGYFNCPSYEGNITEEYKTSSGMRGSSLVSSILQVYREVLRVLFQSKLPSSVAF